MPYQEKQIEKKYFTIGEVAHQLGVATSLLRFWEQEFLDYIKPGRYHKAGRNNRKYTLSDIEDVKKIYYLVKVLGFTLAGARHELIRQEMTIEDYQEVINELPKFYWNWNPPHPPTAKEVEDNLKKLGYKIIKL
jgi:DNA-binding transcriptional MerR regulator